MVDYNTRKIAHDRIKTKLEIEYGEILDVETFEKLPHDELENFIDLVTEFVFTLKFRNACPSDDGTAYQEVAE